MNSKPQMFMVRNYGPQPENVILAFQYAVQMARQSGLTKILLLVPSKQRASSTVVGETLGEDTIKMIAKDGLVVDGIQVTLEGVTRFTKYTEGEIIVAYHVAKDGIDKATDSQRAKAIIFVPWEDSEEESFERTWQPRILEAEGIVTATTSSVSLPPALEDELKSLTLIVNLSTGIGHPSDKRTAQDKFKALKKQGVQIDPEAVRAWAVTHGWQSGDADDLAKLAARYTK